MAEITGFKEVKKTIFDTIASSLQEISDEIEKEVKANLHSNKTALGENQPTKRPSTKAQYAKKGWDQNNWLVRTGNSTQLTSRITKKEVTIRPQGQVLLGSQERLRAAAENVFTITDAFRRMLVDKLKNKLAKEL